MDKKPEDRDTEIPEISLQEVPDFIEELFTSGKVVNVVYGFNDDGEEFCIDHETGDVEITHEDGTVENIPGDDPRAKAILDRKGLG
jgi:hypothetical protein